MDGGIDLAYRRFFGDIQTRLQQKIRRDFFGELPVGQATVISTDHDMIPHLISATDDENPRSN
jgi:O-acetyl-ADP-ribose deacetylase (regulator of RNase III)